MLQTRQHISGGPMSTIRPRVTRRGARVDWVKFDAELARDGSCDPVDKALYAAIASFVDTDTRESPDTSDMDPDSLPEDIPTRRRLAECIGKSVDTVDRATKRLEAGRLLKVHRQADPDNPRRMLPSEYEMLDHHLWDERAAARAARRQARQDAATDSATPVGGRTGAARGSRMDAARGGRTGAAVIEDREVEEENLQEMAPSARSAPDARRASTGSRAHGMGGSAASGKSRSRLTRAEYQAVAAVLELLPDDLARALPTKTPPPVRTAIIEALAVDAPFERTPTQLVEYRVLRRWTGYWAAQFYAGELKSVVGPLLAMLRAQQECGDISCEDRVNIHTGEPCRSCEARKEDRRPGRPDEAAADLPGQRGASPGRPCCPGCQRPLANGSLAVLCRDCRDAPEDGPGASAPGPGALSTTSPRSRSRSCP